MITLMLILVVGACISAVAGALGKINWWWSVGCLCLIELIRVVPIK